MSFDDEMDDIDGTSDIFGEFLPKGTVDLLKSKSSDKGPEGLKKECGWHEWQNYTGLNHSYQYCTRCDAKRDIPK